MSNKGRLPASGRHGLSRVFNVNTNGYLSPLHAQPANLAAHENLVGQGERPDHAVQVDVGSVDDDAGNPVECHDLV